MVWDSDSNSRLGGVDVWRQLCRVGKWKEDSQWTRPILVDEWLVD